jgi:hypothetical protein
VAPRFVLEKDTAGNFRFYLVAANGEATASSEACTSNSDADLWWWAGPGPTVSLALVLAGAYVLRRSCQRDGDAVA